MSPREYFMLALLMLSLGSIQHAICQTRHEMRLLTIQEGLPDRTVFYVTQDDRGLMWFITTDGLSNYNGYEYTHYGMPGTPPNFLSSIAFDNNGGVYVIENASAMYRLAGDRFEPVTLDTSSSITKVRDLAFDSAGHAWVVARNGYSYGVFDSNWSLISKGETWDDSQKLNFSARYKKYLRTNTNGTRIYIQSQSNEVTCFGSDMNILRKYTLPVSIAQSSYIFDFSPDENENVHMICPNGTVASINVQDSAYRIYTELTYRTGEYPVFIDRQGKKLSFGQYWHELGQFDLETGESASIPLETGGYPSVAQTYSITGSPTGNIWVGGELGITIVSEYDPMFEKYDLDGESNISLPGQGIRSILQTPEGLIFSTDHYPFNLLNPDDGSITQLGEAPLIKLKYPSFFHSLAQKDNLIYTVNGIAIDIDNDQVAVAPQFLNEQLIAFDSHGKYYTMQAAGLFIYDKPYGEILDQDIENHYGLNLVPDPNGNMWVCTNHGLYQYTYGKGVVRHISSDSETSGEVASNSPIIIEGLSSAIVNDIAFTDGGTIWVGTSSGLHLLDTVAPSITSINSIDLSSQAIYSILPEGDSALWLGTGNGLVRYDIRTQEIMPFTTNDGLPHNEFNRHARLIADDGWYYMGGIDGICRFRPEAILALNRQKGAHLILDRVMAFDGNETYELNSDSLLSTGRILLRPTDDLLTIGVALSDYLYPERNEYRFFLEGVDPGFNNWNTLPTTTYRNLPAGEYVFVAQARGANRINADNEIRLAIIVKEAYHRTVWFPLLLVLISSSLIYAVVRYRFLQKLKMERLRTRIASDLHDEVGGVLSGIAMQMDLLESDVPDNIRHRMERVSRSSREAASRMRDVIWSVDASRDTFEDLLERMKAHVNELLPPAGVTWKFDVDTSISPELKVNSAVRQNVYLIFKEAITNVAKHSQATHVNIRVNQHNGTGLKIIVSDNGIGFDPDITRSGDGLRNIQRRAVEMNANLNVSINNGVTWTIETRRL